MAKKQPPADAAPRQRPTPRSVLVLHGPNLNLLGTREPEVYGRTTLEDVNRTVTSAAKARRYAVTFRQSNYEGELIGSRETAVGVRRGREQAEPREQEGAPPALHQGAEASLTCVPAGTSAHVTGTLVSSVNVGAV